MPIHFKKVDISTFFYFNFTSPLAFFEKREVDAFH